MYTQRRVLHYDPVISAILFMLVQMYITFQWKGKNSYCSFYKLKNNCNQYSYKNNHLNILLSSKTNLSDNDYENLLAEDLIQ